MKAGERRHVARWAGLGALVVGGIVVAVLATAPQASYTEVYTPLLGKTAPQVTTTTLSGQAFELSSLRGRWVVLNFFATWCAPCQQEQADLVSFYRRHSGADNVALIGVVFDDSASDARQFLAQSHATWPVLVDPDGQIALDYGVRGPPETFIISPEGIVTTHLDGALTVTGLDKVLDEAQTYDQ